MMHRILSAIMTSTREFRNKKLIASKIARYISFQYKTLRCETIYAFWPTNRNKLAPDGDCGPAKCARLLFDLIESKQNVCNMT